MTVDPDAAAASLQDIAETERRAWESVFYAVSSSILILWGVLVAANQLFEYLKPAEMRTPLVLMISWGAVYGIGMGGTYMILRANARPRALSPLGRRIMSAMVVLIGYGMLWTMLLGPAGAKWSGVFWPTLFMFGFVVAGLWVGRFFIFCGLVVTALVVAGYLWLGPWYQPWLAAVEGGALIIGGLWLRRGRS